MPWCEPQVLKESSFRRFPKHPKSSSLSAEKAQAFRDAALDLATYADAWLLDFSASLGGNEHGCAIHKPTAMGVEGD